MERDLSKLTEELVDELEDYVEETEGFFKKTWNKIKTFFSKYLIYILLIAIVALGGYTIKLYNTKNVVKQVEKIVYVDSPEAVINSKNFLMKNLDDMEVTKSRTVKSSVTKEPIFGVWYKKEQMNGESIYIAIFEPVAKLKYNAKEYAKVDKKDDSDLKAE